MTSLYVPPRRVFTLDECLYYHTIELPQVGLVRGAWDLRDGEDAYLGSVELADRSVLEIGPASGFLTAHMESRGATVTAVELGVDDLWDVVPQRTHDLTSVLSDRVGVMERLRNSFWLTHRVLRLTARLYEGSVYALPPELGRFDVAVMAAVLLHTRSPVAVLERVANHVDDTLVIVDRYYPELDGAPVCRLEPTAENGVWDTWWAFSPAFFTAFAGLLGFQHAEVHHHEQTHRYGDDYLQEMRLPMFTVVARRERSAAPRCIAAP
jgi:O-methyltransferase